MILGIGFPNPIGWAIDKVTGFVGGVATAGFEMIIGGLVAWVVDAVVWVVGGVFNFFLDSTDPNVQADWFITGDGPYATTVGIGASLLLLFVLAGIVQGTLSGDVGGMLRRMGLELPISIIGMVGLVTVTQILVQLTDALSGEVLGNFQDDISEFGAVVATLSHLNGGTSTAFVVFVLGLVTVLAGLILVAELVVRSALIYIVVALAPLVFAARLWPATRGASRKLLDLLVALIVSKLVIAIALSVAAAAAVGAGSGGEVTALPEPEVFAEDPGGSVTQAVGILLTAAAAFGVSAFSPLLIARLLPLTEGALVAQGVKGGPVRAGQQGMMAANT
ncbi:MAG: type IV secretion system protein, partial [Acidimicrobiales bacterium]